MKTAAFADGSFVSVWQDGSGTGTDTSGTAIRGQIFNADGSKRGGEFIVNTITEQDQTDPVITVLSDGRFVVAWTDKSTTEDAEGSGIRARIFNPDGTAFNRTGAAGGDADFQVNITSQAGSQKTPAITALANGGFVIAFQDIDGASDEIKAHVFDARGLHLGSEVQVSSNSGEDYSNPTVVAAADGYTVFYETDAGSLRGRVFHTDGREPSSEFDIPTSGAINGLSHTAKLSDGRYVVTWVSNLQVQGSSDPVYSSKAQIFNADGSKFGGEFSVNGSDTPVQVALDVTALSNGGFAVALASATALDLTENGKLDIGVVFFDAYGSKTAVNAKISEVPTAFYANFGFKLSISALADDRVVVTSAYPNGASDINVTGHIVDGRTTGVSVSGSAGNDVYYGSAFNDTLNGAAGNDRLTGEAGDDILNGGAGLDVMIGGLGNDTYHLDNAGDQVTELAGGGVDTIVSSFSYTLAAELENLTGSGSAALRFTGNAVANAITGAGGKDRLDGGLGNDTLGGGSGNDTLIGGKGKDVFVFAATLGTHKTDRKVNFDTISDFKLKEDKIHLENAIFAKLKKPGKLSKSFFSLDKANDKNDFIIYSKAKGVLSYDADGSGTKAKAVEFAKVKAGLNLTAGDFIVI